MKKITILSLATLFLLSLGIAQKHPSSSIPLTIIPANVTLVFPNASLSYNVRTGKIHEEIVGKSITTPAKWGIFRCKKYLFHIHHDYMGRHFWKVNTGRKIFFTADGNYRIAGGAPYTPPADDVKVIVAGNPLSPARFKLVFKKAILKIDTRARKVTKTILYDTNLTTPEEWKVCVGKTIVDIQNISWATNQFLRIDFRKNKILFVKKGVMCGRIISSFRLRNVILYTH